MLLVPGGRAAGAAGAAQPRDPAQLRHGGPGR